MFNLPIYLKLYQFTPAFIANLMNTRHISKKKADIG